MSYLEYLLYWKRPEYAKEGYPEGTDKIFSRDALVEMIILILSVLNNEIIEETHNHRQYGGRFSC